MKNNIKLNSKKDLITMILIGLLSLISIVLFTSNLIFSQNSSPIDVDKAIEEIDNKLTTNSDFSANTDITSKRPDKNTGKMEKKVTSGTLYRDDDEDKFLFIFTSPKVDAGKGYLYIDDNLWFYDPSSGEFAKKTVSESIGDSNSRSRDLEKSKLSETYEFKYLGEDKIGKIECYVLAGKA
ncbi:MAG: outer membrane lipoprotein-sorting protein, partial [Spirochaetota bacterium]